MINNIWAIFRKEFQSYFTAANAYIIMGIFWLVAGFFFNSLLYGIILDVSIQEQSGFLVARDTVSEFMTTFIGIILSLSSSLKTLREKIEWSESYLSIKKFK